MKPGIYHVQFKSSQQACGEGLAVFKDASINGGDQGYLYIGTYQENDRAISATLRIKKWQVGAVSIFGPVNEFDLNLKGTLLANGADFNVSGTSPQIPGATITISGRRISDAA